MLCNIYVATPAADCTARHERTMHRAGALWRRPAPSCGARGPAASSGQQIAPGQWQQAPAGGARPAGPPPLPRLPALLPCLPSRAKWRSARFAPPSSAAGTAQRSEAPARCLQRPLPARHPQARRGRPARLPNRRPLGPPAVVQCRQDVLPHMRGAWQGGRAGCFVGQDDCAPLPCCIGEPTTQSITRLGNSQPTRPYHRRTGTQNATPHHAALAGVIARAPQQRVLQAIHVQRSQLGVPRQQAKQLHGRNTHARRWACGQGGVQQGRRVRRGTTGGTSMLSPTHCPCPPAERQCS